MSEVLEQLDEQPEVITPEQEQVDVPEGESASESVEQPKEHPQDKNWRAARARMEEDAREKRLQQQKIELLQQEVELLRRTMPQAKEPEEDISHFTETERQLYSEIKNLKKELHKSKPNEVDYALDRLRAKYSDFDDVMSPENISYLQTNNAALAKALASLKDSPYEQGLAAYDTLKNTEWYQKRNSMEDKQKLEQNIKKPMSVQAVRKQGALSEANRFDRGLTTELKKQLQKEMAEARKGA